VSSILLADDNPHAQRMGSQILSQEGHSVVTVSDGDEAMQYLEENLPDLVMVDTRMPGPSGFDICKHVKSEPRFRGVRVVLLAGPLEPFDTAEAESAGPDGVLHKPLDAYTLIDTVNSLLGQVRETADPAPEPERAARPEPLPQFQPRSNEPAPATSRVASVVETAVAELSVDLTDPFASAVEKALGTENAQSERRARIEMVVREVLESATPAIVERVAQRVMDSLDER
jgi:CheY-like chemotaxis protein